MVRSINVCFLIFVLSNKGEENMGTNITVRKKGTFLWKEKYRPWNREAGSFVVSALAVGGSPYPSLCRVLTVKDLALQRGSLCSATDCHSLIGAVCLELRSQAPGL